MEIILILFSVSFVLVISIDTVQKRRKFLENGNRV
jgi:hypothetical protein